LEYIESAKSKNQARDMVIVGLFMYNASGSLYGRYPYDDFVSLIGKSRAGNPAVEGWEDQRGI
jgi:hypothetical protein